MVGVSAWNGSAWVAAEPYVWNGGAWVQPYVYAWDGDSWGLVDSPLPPIGAIRITAPSWVLSTQSGAQNPGETVINPGSFTVSLDNPEQVENVSFQMRYQGGGWTHYQWVTVAASTTFTQAFSTHGQWEVIAVATIKAEFGGGTIQTSIPVVWCYIKSLGMSVTPTTNPTLNQVVSLNAYATDDPYGLGASASTWWYWDGSTWNTWGAENPKNWTADRDLTWMWRETFAEGSYISSNRVFVDVQAAATEVVVNGGHCHDIQNGMNSANAQGLPLRLTGTFYVYTNVLIPSNLSINADGAMFYVNTEPGGAYNAGRFRNDTHGNAPEYGQSGWWTWNGGTFDGNGEGIFTVSHSPGFTIQNARFYRYCSASNTGHAIEINSSGGYDAKHGAYNVRITSNTFHGTNLGQRSNSNDEPCHFDWNWNGSGASAPVWTAGDPVSEATQVMCHNVLINGNTFHRASESGWEFALCAIGGHSSADSAYASPAYRHNSFLVEGNAIHGAVGSTGTSPDKGAIHMHWVRQAVVRSNTIYGGVNYRLLTAKLQADADLCSASGNSAPNNSGTGADPNIYYVRG